MQYHAPALMKWTEREFRFGYTNESIPFLIERLRATAPRIADLIQGASEEDLAQRPGGRWSVKEHIGHLGDLETLHEGRLDDFSNRLATLRPADMTNRETEEARHNATGIDLLQRRFATVRGNFFEKLRQLPAVSLQHRSLHPRLQQMINVADMLYFMAEHDNHHLTVMSMQLGDGAPVLSGPGR